MSVPLLIIAIVIPILVLVLVSAILINKINPKLNKHSFKINDVREIEFHNNKNETPYLVKKNSDGSVSDDDFRIVCCADMHLSTDECEFGLMVLERLIDKTHPDLLVLLGDNVCGRLDTAIEQKLIKLIEKKKLYYAFVLGNHDSEHMINTELKKHVDVTKESYGSVQKKCRTFRFKALADSKYFVGELNSKLFGAGTYAINIKNSSGVIKTLYFFDSGDYAFGVKRKAKGSETRSYDHIHDDQLEWYKNEVKKNNASSIAFLHIPLKEYQNAYRLSLVPLCFHKRLFGNNYEKPCYSDDVDHTFKVFKEYGSTEVVVAGHDHKNDSCIEYKGIKLMYSQGLQYDGSYNRRKKNPWIFRFLYKLGFKCYVEGVTIFDINQNHVEITPVYAENEGVFTGLEKYYKRAWLEDTHYGVR